MIWRHLQRQFVWLRCSFDDREPNRRIDGIHMVVVLGVSRVHYGCCGPSAERKSSTFFRVCNFSLDSRTRILRGWGIARRRRPRPLIAWVACQTDVSPPRTDFLRFNCCLSSCVSSFVCRSVFSLVPVRTETNNRRVAQVFRQDPGQLCVRVRQGGPHRDRRGERRRQDDVLECPHGETATRQRGGFDGGHRKVKRVSL